MRIPRFYLPAPLAVGTTVALDDQAFNHAVRVLRLKPGAALIVFDGAGGAFAATLVEAGRREARARVTEALPGAVRHDAAAGHIGMVAGRTAETALWRPLLDWVRGLE